ncbi:MAG TPA: flagellar biosynthesis protein FliQ [Bacteroidota bacterium]|nr:flagellar biosynthesis protein FliQ [Bacteroidota bacterium]
MSQEFVIYVFREALYTALLVSAPLLVVSLVVGLLISIFQAATSIQEITLTFVPKLIVIGIVAVLTLPWMIDVIVSFTTGLFNNIPALGH